MNHSLLISGIKGRMGQVLITLAYTYGFVVTTGIGKEEGQEGDIPVYTDFAKVPGHQEAIIDFSAPALLPKLLSYATKKKVPCVLGTTGYTQDDLDAIKAASQSTAIFYSPNLSTGLYVLKHLARETARMLPEYDIEIVERHHQQKADSPSGTAFALFDAVKSDKHQAVFGRKGMTGPRQNNEIGIHAIRGGTQAGEHQVGFYGHQEMLTLTHTAQDKEVFAAGALRAARFLLGKPPGLYGMDDMMMQK